MSPNERLEFHRLALKELLDARDWYDIRSETAGRGFRVAVLRAVDRIAADSEAIPIVFGTFRYVRLARFPYVVVFRRVESRLLIVAIAHTSRRPGYWRHRE